MSRVQRPLRHWLMKTEPETFSFDDLCRAPGRTTSWEGVRNYQARNMMRDEFKLGDLVLIYHSSCGEPGIVGTAEVVREAHPDLTALNPESPYVDPRSLTLGASRWLMVDVKARGRFAHPVTLERLRLTPELGGMMVLKRGMRLSIQPVLPEEWAIIMGLETWEPLGSDR